VVLLLLLLQLGATVGPALRAVAAGSPLTWIQAPATNVTQRENTGHAAIQRRQARGSCGAAAPLHCCSCKGGRVGYSGSWGGRTPITALPGAEYPWWLGTVPRCVVLQVLL
jgi:hypothetical protein